MAAPRKPAAAKRTPVRKTTVRAMMIVDNGPIREAALAEYLEVETEIATVRDQLEAFQTGDVPAYERWEAKVFGALLTQLRETNTAVDEKRRLLEAIDEEMFWSGCSVVTAYRRVMEARENPEAARAARAERERAETPPDEDGEGPDYFGTPDFDVLPKDFDVDEFDAAPKSAQREFRRAIEAMAALYAELTGMPAPSFESILEKERAKKHGHGPKAHGGGHGEARHFEPEPDAPDARLKDLYRRLVRLLHPDSTGKDTPRLRELWHELQEAYRTRDLERMEAVAGRADLGMNGTAAALSVGLLRRMIRDLHDALEGMRGQVARARKHPAWNFRRRGKELPKLEKTRRKALERGLEQAIWTLEDFTRELDALAKRAARRTQKKAKPAPRPKPQKKTTKAKSARRESVQFEFF